MKIAILFEGNPKKPGGFYQSLQSASILNEIKDEKFDLEFICLEKGTYNLLKKKKFNVSLFNNSFYKKIFNFFLSFQFFNNLILNYRIQHPFSTFLNKNEYSLIIFLSPSVLSYHCGKINFIINIWDLDHKKNSPYPEHRINYNFIKREQLINYSIFHSVQVIVPDEKTKNELIKTYNCDKSKLIVQSFIPYLPKLFENKKADTDFKKLFDRFEIPDKKIILYPATFWPHKNHKYLIDASRILKDKNNNDYLFVFCGPDSGNLNFIKDEIKKFSLEKYCKILPLVNDLELISLYLHSYAIAMPTTGGPTNLPIYESFYFKKIIFYSDHLIEERELSENLVPINIQEPNDFCKKIINLKNEDIKLITERASEFYQKRCSFENLKTTYLSAIKDFLKNRSKWK
jgi:glycosyltransferase involved in cell wall biosynthesis